MTFRPSSAPGFASGIWFHSSDCVASGGYRPWVAGPVPSGHDRTRAGYRHARWRDEHLHRAARRRRAAAGGADADGRAGRARGPARDLPAHRPVGLLRAAAQPLLPHDARVRAGPDARPSRRRGQPQEDVRHGGVDSQRQGGSRCRRHSRQAAVAGRRQAGQDRAGGLLHERRLRHRGGGPASRPHRLLRVLLRNAADHRQARLAAPHAVGHQGRGLLRLRRARHLRAARPGRRLREAAGRPRRSPRAPRRRWARITATPSPTAATYNAAACEKHYERMLALYRRHLG